MMMLFWTYLPERIVKSGRKINVENCCLALVHHMLAYLPKNELFRPA